MSFPFVQPYFGLGNSLQTAQGSAGGAAAGGWVELARTTLGSAGDTISVGSLSDKRYYMILANYIPSGNIETRTRLNSDSGSNYSSRYTENGGSDSTVTNTVSMLDTFGASSSANDMLSVGYLSNLSTKEKLYQVNTVRSGTSGAANAPSRIECVGKHAQTTNPVSTFSAHNADGGDYAIGSEIVVLGWDPADTHTTNFWEELASVDITSGSQMTANFTAKKYLWIQFYYDVSTSSSELFFNNDQGNNYARRYSNNGGTDSTNTSIAAITTNFGFDTNPHYGNMFVVNNSANEKLVIAHLGMQMGAGAATAPGRTELVSKWANTSAQINRFDIKNTGSFSRGICKVWGSD
jgi:hypothetical protein